MADMADGGKKRKRAADGTSIPSKKPAPSISAGLPDITVSIVAEGDEFAPIVVNTPGVAISSSIPLQPYLKCRKDVLRHGSGGSIAKQEILLQSSEHPTIDYTGREEEAGGTDSLLKHYLGVFDPTTGKLQVMEARKMAVRGIVRIQQAAPEALQERGAAMNMRDLRNDLGQTFGTKKARKAISSLTENAISPVKSARYQTLDTPARLDSVTSAMLATMADATAGIATRDELQAAVDDAKPRPKANRSAENVNEVYTIDTLIGLDVMKSIPAKDWQDTLKAKKEIISMSKYVAHRVQKLALDVQKLKTLRFLECLLAFYNATKPRRSTRQVPRRDDLRAAMDGVPEAIVESIRRKFSSGNEMSKFQTDLLITHVCALAFLVDNYEVDMYDLREDLKLEVKDLSTYFQELGAKVTNIGAAEGKKLGLDKAGIAQRRVARLKLPLDFPKVRFMRKK